MSFRLKNFTIKEFNRDVNDSGDLKIKYKMWSEYRCEIKSLIDSAIEFLPETRSIIVLGSGNLNDLDMNYLCRKFSEIVLTDADTKSIEAGLKGQGIDRTNSGKVHIYGADYTGSDTVGLFKQLNSLITKAAPAKDIVDYLNNIFLKMVPMGFEEKFDLVLACPVYTQLVYTQIEFFLKILYDYGLYEYHELNKILTAAYNNMPKLISNFNNLMISSCKDEGLMIMLTDIIEMKKDEPINGKIKKMLNENDEKLEKIISKKGIELAQIGKDDFNLKTNQINSLYTLWPFDKDKDYLVYASVAKI